MKQRRIAWALLLLMCASALLSGALLILYGHHECLHEACTVCAVLEKSRQAELMALALLTAVCLMRMLRTGSVAPAENQFIPDWTPVQLKVKMLD